jgi:hypothetical protein
MEKILLLLPYLPPDFFVWLLMCFISAAAGRYINPKLETLNEWKNKPENQGVLAVLGAAYRVLDPILMQLAQRHDRKRVYEIIEEVIRGCADGHLSEEEISKAMKMFGPVYDPIVAAGAPMNDLAQALLDTLEAEQKKS